MKNGERIMDKINNPKCIVCGHLMIKHKGKDCTVRGCKCIGLKLKGVKNGK